MRTSGVHRGLPALAGAAAAAVVCASVAAGPVRSVVYGGSVTLSGKVPTASAGQPVSILARPHGESAFERVGVVTTRAGGAWAYVARPSIRTIYRAEWQGNASARIAVTVSPFLNLRVDNGVVRARARVARPLTGRYVLLQSRRSGARFHTLRKLILNRQSTATARQRLPRGRTELRLYMPAAQAGPGYQAGSSSILVYTNRT
ncbi:MAG: hypothetical protein ABR583_04680 [Gaiellaceae bacterium]